MTSERFMPDDKLVLTNLKKVFWPAEGYTKGDLIDYYRTIASIIVPYLVDRPQVLHRHVDGAAGKEFYQRVSRSSPRWVKTIEIPLDEGNKLRDYHLCQDWPTLLWMANFGCIELIPWNSRVGSLDRPDYLVIDLDPVDVPFAAVVEAAVAIRKIFDQTGVESFCKTSGKRGLHVYVPLGRKYTHEQAKIVSELVAHLVHRQLPATTSLDIRTEKRKGLIYLDRTRNAQGQAVAVAYCARPYPGATVSCPLKWSEVIKTLNPSNFTIKTMPKRIDKLGDLWQGVLGPGMNLEDWLARFQKICG